MTDRKHAEEMLKKALKDAKEEKAKTDAVIAAIGDQMIILDPEFKIIYENDYAVKTIGSHRGELCFRAYERRDTVCKDCPVALSFQDGLIHRTVRIPETVVGTMHLDICASPLKDASGNVVAVIEMVRDITDQKKAEETLRKSHEELEKLVRVRTAELILSNEELRKFSRYLEEAREKERTIIAREIHDELGQSLTALKMDLSILVRRLPNAEKKIVEKTQSMAALIETTIQNVKRISTELRPGILDHLGLSAALDWQAEEFEKRTGIFCDVVFEPEEIIVDRGRTTAVFRIFQETLTNVARHAHASKVSVLLKREDGELVLQVKDDGDGITKDQVSDGRSLGLIGMRERVNYWGGSLVISGERNKGTTIAARIPLGTPGETA
jgi:signal transduction histidine kinase